MGECRKQKHTQHAPSTKTECDNLYGWIKKKKVTYEKKYKNFTQNSEPQRDTAGNAEEEEKEI